MINYTEQLKEYWNTDNLTFIATLNKINDEHGYFLNFINPVDKKTLDYPSFEGVEIMDDRISFIYFKVTDLEQNELYKVKLMYTSSPKGKNNPYSLKVKSVKPLNSEERRKFLNERDLTNKYNGITFYGRYSKKNEKFACFENVMFSETGEILMFQGESQKAYVSPNLNLTEGSYYQFAFIENEGKLPSAIPNTIEILKKNPYKVLIQERFQLHNNPASNKTNAKTMREIGIGMYSSKERMIYELLQNADDAPGKDKVEFHIDINGDYFFIMHDGAPFNKKDIKAITSAGESTKEKSKNKTGYKGIGFKSVFTNSTEVWLKSGGYQFAFLKDSNLFKDFDALYFPENRRKQFTEEGLSIEQDRFAEQKEDFDSSLHIPWQLMPIWQDNLPQDFNETNFDNYNNPVQFALKLGQNNIRDYKKAVDNITKRPQFLLFLRNTSKFNARKNGVMVLRKDYNGIIEILKLKGEENSRVFYTKQSFEDVEVSDKAFEQSGVGLKKKSEINENTKVARHYFTDLDGNRLDEIPSKLASVDLTQISFAIKISDNKIIAEDGYLNDSQNFSSLFTYLPMDDKRLILPFLVNADFIPDSRRENLQYGSPWNKYIMIKVAEKHVATLAYFAKDFLKDKDKNSSYLSLLLKYPLPDDDTAQQIIDSYNNTYLKELNKKKIVVNDNNQTQLLSETIIDTSGITELLGYEIFYKIIDTQKRLPHFNLNSSYLKNYDYLQVEYVEIEEIGKYITLEICVLIGQKIVEKSLYDKPELLKWLNDLAVYTPNYFGKIPFIIHNKKSFSLESLIAENDAWIINENTYKYEDLLKELGYHTINLELEKFSNISNYLIKFKGYVNDKSFAYERIKANAHLSTLTTETKLKLIDFLQNSEFMVGIGETKYFGELELFTNENGKAVPLRQLLSRQEEIEINSIHQFRISENEFSSFPETLKKELIPKEKIFNSFVLDYELFSEWSEQFNSENITNYVEDLKTIYNWVENTDEISSANWASIPWLFINDDLRFLGADKVYWSTAFYKMSSKDYDTIKTILKIKNIPIQVCGELIQTFKLKTDDGSEIDWTEIDDLEMISTNTFLDWMQNDGNFSDFFEQYTISATEKGLWAISEIEGTQIFDGSNKELKIYIQSHKELKTLFTELDNSLCTENRYKIGLLQGDSLIKAIIDSKAFDQNLAKHLPSHKSWAIIQDFILNLRKFNLITGLDYNSYSPEHIVIHSLLRTVEDINLIPDEILTIIETLRDKININENSLSTYDLSDRIQFGTGTDKKVLNLSDVLPGFKGKSDVLDVIIESFVSIKEKAKLRKLIFKTRPMQLNEIHSKIEENANTFYSVHQVIFQLLDKKYGGKRKWLKMDFDVYYTNQEDEAQLGISYQSFFDILLELDFTELSDFEFQHLVLKNCVDRNFAIESEIIPQWLEDWVNKDKTKRLDFISKLGYNGLDSPIVRVRKFSIAENYLFVSVMGNYEQAKQNVQITWNTIHWLASFSSEIITRNAELIKKINNTITLSTSSQSSIVIPTIEGINNDGDRIYNLKRIKVGSHLYLLSDYEEFDDLIFAAVKKENEYSIFIDSVCGKMSAYFNTEVVELIENIDLEKLENESILWEEPFYKKWEHYTDYPVYIYRGNEIPFIRTFNGIVVNRFTSDLKACCDGKYYVSSVFKNDILNNLPSGFPENILSHLIEWHYKTLKNESLLDEDSFEYKEDIDRLLQDRLGISEEDQKRESGNAKAHAVYFLDERGFDVSNVNISGAALTNIIDSEGNHINCIVRSAKGGLLYLDKEHWDMLDEDNMYLIVIYPGNSPRMFKNRLELLEEELAENILFRIPNNKNTSEIDGVFKSLESEPHIILVTSEKMKENLFSKLKQKRDFDKEENAAVGSDDFTL